MLLGKALQMLCEQISFLFGNIPFLVLSLIAILAGAVIFWKDRRAVKPRLLIPVVVSLTAIVAIFGLFLAMIARHPAVYRVPDHHLWYYTLTIQAVFLFGLSVWPTFFDPEQRARFAPLAHIAIGSLVVLNVLGYNRQRDIMIHSMQYFGVQYENTQNVIEQFKSDPPRRDKLLTRSNDVVVDDPEHFLENVELSYLHLTGALETERPPQQ